MAYSNRERPGGRAGLRDNTPTTFRPVAYRNLAARKNLWADYTCLLYTSDAADE